MRLLLHDFGCYPFPWQLAKSLRGRGHQIRFCYSASEPRRSSIPVNGSEDADPQLEIAPIVIPGTLKRESLWQRRKWTCAYGAAFAAEIRRYKPEYVVSANTPLDAQSAAHSAARAVGSKFVYWLQDILSMATRAIISKRSYLLGALAGWYYERTEQSLLRRSDQVIVITPDFYDVTDRFGVPRERVHLLPNWCPLDDIPVLSRDNAWATARELENKLCVMYSGQLGMKHNPQALVSLAQALQVIPDARLVIVAEGPGADKLKEIVKTLGLNNVLMLPFNTYEDLPKSLATADVLVAILDDQGGSYCVPSKVLTYLCAGRPIVMSVKEDNLAGRIIHENHAGLVVRTSDHESLIKAVEQLLSDPAMRQSMGQSGRAYAESHFDIERITDRFESILLGKQLKAEDGRPQRMPEAAVS
jgi:glycosyltransferase involved in cell wall biosynthesis